MANFNDTGLILPFFRPTLIFMANLSISNSGLVFREWNYATISITFDFAFLPASGDPKSSVCLNISYKVTLMDRTWLMKKHQIQKISVIPVPLKVKGISTSKHKLGKFVLVALYILDFSCD